MSSRMRNRRLLDVQREGRTGTSPQDRWICLLRRRPYGELP